MRIVLGKKQNMLNGQWLAVAKDIESYVSEAELDSAVRDTLARAERDLAGRSCMFGWSGGKDAAVAASLCQELGIKRGAFVHTELEYPEFMRWALSNLPSGCEPVNTGQNLEWLRDNPKFLFPKTSDILGRTYQIVQRKGNAKFAREYGCDKIVTGRRRADGNVKGATAAYYDIIYDWPHELVFAYLHYRRIPLAPIYSWPDGYRQGTHAWPFRYAKGRTDAEMWREVFGISPSLRKDVSKYFPEVLAF